MKHLRAKIISHQTQKNNVIVYSLQVTDQNTNQSKLIRFRYSQLFTFHQQLQDFIFKLKLDIMLPDFPSKKLVGSTNKSEQSISIRKKQLNDYLNELLSIDKLYHLQMIRKYFFPDYQVLDKNQKYQHFNIRFFIDRYVLVDDAVVYFVRLRDLDTREQWTYKTRYSQLKNIHEALEQANIRDLPPFPKKKIFGITNQSLEKIEKRRSELQKYFNEVFNSKEVLESEAIAFFIKESKKQAKEDIKLQAIRKNKKI